MSKHLLGMHWLRYHPDMHDFEHVEAMQYRSAKPFEWMWNNVDFCRDLLTVLPKDAYITARDHPLSEQKEDMWRDPEGTGTRHANEWADKVRSRQYHLPVDRTFFLGINEPDATNGDRNAIDIYTESFLNRLAQHGLRGGAFNFSTGHPRTVDGTPNTQADYTVFERSHRAIVEGNHIALAHIYGTAAVPLAKGHYDRLWACDWQDVEWIIGEFGIDEHVVGGGEHHGWKHHLGQWPNAYCAWIDEAIRGIDDPRIHSYQVYSYDFSHPWDSFDVQSIRGALEAYPWQHATPVPVVEPIKTILPIIGNGKPVEPTKEVPMNNAIIEPIVAQAILQIESGGRTHGDDGRIIIRFEAHIFKTYFGNDFVFYQHFGHDAHRPWVDQTFEGKPLHTSKQADEYAAFEFAKRLNAEAAYKSISMGAPQIMGFNHARIGYASAAEMFASFQTAQLQTIGFINFCLSDPDLAAAMRRKDWREVARRYNGSGAIDTYAPLLEQAYNQLGA